MDRLQFYLKRFNVRTKLLISLVWVISFVICFPPLIGWSGAHLADTTTAANTRYTHTGGAEKPGVGTQKITTYSTGVSGLLLLAD